jgi:pimeloyl-ACP methyl ester carboxylesterase
VIDAIRRGDVDPALDAARLGLLGHSRGGGVALLVASRDPGVRAVVAWASIASFDRWTPRAKDEWRARGRIDVPNLRTGQVLWLDREVLEDLERSRGEYDLEAAARRLAAPLLLIHGQVDEAVDPGESERLLAWAAPAEKRLLRIARAGHTFGAVHPWAGPTPAWEEAVGATVEWLAAHL